MSDTSVAVMSAAELALARSPLSLYGVDEIYHKGEIVFNSCVNCKKDEQEKKTFMICLRCLQLGVKPRDSLYHHYCSKECQNAHWKIHRIEHIKYEKELSHKQKLAIETKREKSVATATSTVKAERVNCDEPCFEVTKPKPVEKPRMLTEDMLPSHRKQAEFMATHPPTGHVTFTIPAGTKSCQFMLARKKTKEEMAMDRAAMVAAGMQVEEPKPEKKKAKSSRKGGRGGGKKPHIRAVYTHYSNSESSGATITELPDSTKSEGTQPTTTTTQKRGAAVANRREDAAKKLTEKVLVAKSTPAKNGPTPAKASKSEGVLSKEVGKPLTKVQDAGKSQVNISKKPQPKDDGKPQDGGKCNPQPLSLSQKKNGGLDDSLDNVKNHLKDSGDSFLSKREVSLEPISAVMELTPNQEKLMQVVHLKMNQAFDQSLPTSSCENFGDSVAECQKILAQRIDESLGIEYDESQPVAEAKDMSAEVETKTRDETGRGENEVEKKDIQRSNVAAVNSAKALDKVEQKDVSKKSHTVGDLPKDEMTRSTSESLNAHDTTNKVKDASKVTSVGSEAETLKSGLSVEPGLSPVVDVKPSDLEKNQGIQSCSNADNNGSFESPSGGAVVTSAAMDTRNEPLHGTARVDKNVPVAAAKKAKKRKATQDDSKETSCAMFLASDQAAVHMREAVGEVATHFQESMDNLEACGFPMGDMTQKERAQLEHFFVRVNESLTSKKPSKPLEGCRGSDVDPTSNPMEYRRFLVEGGAYDGRDVEVTITRTRTKANSGFMFCALQFFVSRKVSAFPKAGEERHGKEKPWLVQKSKKMATSAFLQNAASLHGSAQDTGCDAEAMASNVHHVPKTKSHDGAESQSSTSKLPVVEYAMSSKSDKSGDLDSTGKFKVLNSDKEFGDIYSPEAVAQLSNPPSVDVTSYFNPTKEEDPTYVPPLSYGSERKIPGTSPDSSHAKKVAERSAEVEDKPSIFTYLHTKPLDVPALPSRQQLKSSGFANRKSVINIKPGRFAFVIKSDHKYRTFTHLYAKRLLVVEERERPSSP